VLPRSDPRVGSFFGSGDVESLQHLIADSQDAIGRAVQACRAALTPSQLGDFAALDAQCTRYVGVDPVAAFFDYDNVVKDGQAILRRLGTWPPILAAAGCRDVPPSPPVPVFETPVIDETPSQLLARGGGILEGALLLAALYFTAGWWGKRR
jgi:hypothetical protein